MPISEIVKAWCKERNTQTGANRWFWAFWLSILVCFAVLWQTLNFGAVIAAIVLALLWNLFASKPVHYDQLRTVYRGWLVEDSLLAQIADAQSVPEWIKTAIANELVENNRITFEALFQIEGWIESEADRQRVESGRGFQKMAAFSQKNVGR